MLETMRKSNELNTINCLILDDDKFSRTFIKTALLRIGVRNIKEAENAKEALEILQTNRMDIILLDQEMPDVKGIEFIKDIRTSTDVALKNTPIIMISIDTRENTVKNAKKLGICDYLVKPISPLLLKKRIMNALNISQGK
ncbi:MAG: PleD family two-component system response regulator [Alphaproteobacteria bacterium]